VKRKIEEILNLFPEVMWDRWSGSMNVGAMDVFGWIAREDGRYDFCVLLFFDGEVSSIITSSARYSEEFSNRLGFTGHNPCKRVEKYFPNAKAVRL
jgi:hypothetical protein